MSDSSQQIEYCASATFAFVLYDWMINLDQEIMCFWGVRGSRRFTATSLLYGLSRYSVIIGEFVQVQSILPRSDAACQVNVHFQTVVMIVYALIPAIFSTLRVYALSPNDKLVPVLTCLLLSVPVVVVSVFLGAVRIAPQTRFSDCSIYESQNLVSTNVIMGLLIAGKICAIVGSLIVLFVTWHETHASHKAHNSEGIEKLSLVGVVFYNGATYFLIIIGMNFVSLIVVDGLVEGFIFYATPPVTAVLTSRFLLDLSETGRAIARPSSPLEAAPTQSLHVADRRSQSRATLPPFIASMGASVPGTGLHLVDSVGLDDEEGDVAHEKERPCQAGENDLLLGDENEVGGVNTGLLVGNEYSA